MADITYENLVAARAAKKADSGEMDLVKMANLALGILEQVNRIKGGGDNVVTSRAPENASVQGAKTKSPIDADAILEALKTVKSLKGDIKISELEKLLKEHKDQVTMLLGKL